MNMEFFDFTGTNEEEKAQALEIIAQESSGVEFFLNYTTIVNNYQNNHYQNNSDEHSKSSYLHVNGDLSSQNGNPSSSSSTANNNHHNNHPSSQHHHHHHHLNNNSRIIENSRRPPPSHQPMNNNYRNNHSNTPLNEWETANNNNRNIANNTNNSNNESTVPNSNVLVAAIQAPPANAAPQYIFTSATHPYFAHPPPPPPPNHYISIHPGPISPHPVNALPNQPKMCLQQVMPNIVSSSSMANKNSTKSTTVNTSSCDIRSFPQYSDATQLVDGSRLNKSVPGDGSSMISGDSMVSSGAAVAAVPHLGPPYNYAFPHNALPFHPHGPHLQPLYFLTHPPDGYLPYPAFSPNTAPPAHLAAPISAATVVHPNVMAPPVVAPITNHPNNQNSTSATSSKSSLSGSSITATVSNLSSMSASSSSIAYQSSLQQNSASETPSFETNNIKNNDEDCIPAPSISQNSMSDNEKETIVADKNLENVPLQSKSQGEPVPSSSNSVNNEVNHAQEYLKLCLNINNKPNENKAIVGDVVLATNSSPDENIDSAQNTETATEVVIEDIDNENGLCGSEKSVFDDKNTCKSPEPPKPTTWASKLFPTAISSPLQTLPLSNSTSDNNQSISGPKANEDSNTIPSENGKEVKSNLQNGDYPVLNAKNSVNNNNNSTHSNNNHIRRGRFFNHDDDFKKITIISMKNDQIANRLAKRLRDTIRLKHSLPTIMPCGLVNRGNWCYVNATLQALLACPPFYNLMREISETPGLFRTSTSTPIIDNFARYFSKFLPTDYRRQTKSAGNAYLEELLNNDPFEPVFIYDTLKHIGMIKNDAQRGHQEDAEEFLSSVLNGLNEEMINLSKLLSEKKSLPKSNGFGSEEAEGGDHGINAAEEDGHHEDENVDSNDIWHEVGTSKHKSLPTRSAKTVSTAITEIFGGSTLDIRTVNKDKNSCGNRQPFFTLQLDIKPPSIRSLDDAIRWQTKSETIHGYTCSKTKQIVDASSQMFLENLPPILIFHLKLFDYEIETGASKKLLKTIYFPENFEIPRECITGKSDGRCRIYKLLAVVYHNGSEVVNGHYITDVYHLGLNHWLRCDDASIKVISLPKVLNGNERESNLVPYLLFYRRYDTLNSNYNHTSNNSSHNNMQANFGTNSSNHNAFGTKRMSSSANNHYNNDQNSHHHDQHHHHHQHQHNENNEMSTSNKFSFISRQF